jgi:murein DD-endopeptidase MepM/ murein hydrolase activator NlpD
VRASTYSSGYGNLVIIRHENGLETYYGHLSKREVEVGDWVHAGDEIGLGGSTGRSTGPHLHFETRYMGFAFDPEWIADYETGQLRKNVFVLRRSYLNANSHYVPETIDEEEEIYASEEKIVEEEKRIAAERAAMRYYTVKSGDTLGAIAKREGKSLGTIQKLNPGINPNKLRIGQKIRVN